MDITPSVAEDRQVIDSYGPGRFKISQTDYTGPLIVLPHKVLPWPDGAHSDALKRLDLTCMTSCEPSIELVLIGTGDKMHRVPTEIVQAIKDQYGVTVEFMATGPACRTYNILLAEGREVAAVLVPV